jgi:hypothetical protein
MLSTNERSPEESFGNRQITKAMTCFEVGIEPFRTL